MNKSIIFAIGVVVGISVGYIMFVPFIVQESDGKGAMHDLNLASDEFISWQGYVQGVVQRTEDNKLIIENNQRAVIIALSDDVAVQRNTIETPGGEPVTEEGLSLSDVKERDSVFVRVSKERDQRIVAQQIIILTKPAPPVSSE